MDTYRASTPNPTSRRFLGILLFAAVLLVLASCAPGPNPQVGVPTAAGDLPGFWLGLWHGIIAPITFVISLFTDDVSLYAVHNSGNWYDFGFFLGFGVLLGGGGSRARGR